MNPHWYIAICGWSVLLFLLLDPVVVLSLFPNTAQDMNTNWPDLCLSILHVWSGVTEATIGNDIEVSFSVIRATNEDRCTCMH